MAVNIFYEHKDVERCGCPHLLSFIREMVLSDRKQGIPMTIGHDVEIAVIGAGFAGIATAYYLCTEYKKTSVLLIDSRQAMGFTSAQSGDNYRNWWPHPIMVDLKFSTSDQSRNFKSSVLCF